MVPTTLLATLVATLTLIVSASAEAQSNPPSNADICRADVSKNLIVDRADTKIVNAAFRSKRGQPKFNEAVDFNGNGAIDVADRTFVSAKMGLRCQPGAPPPTIAATVTPAANAAGWHATDVTITFACTNAVACPVPVAVKTEGANQVVERTVVNTNGVSAVARVTLNIDKTAPVVTMTAPVQAAPGQSIDLQLTIVDLSGAVVAELFDGGALSATDVSVPWAFSFVVPPTAENGTGRRLLARVRDRAGNLGGVEESVVVVALDTAPPAVSVSAPPVAPPGTLVPLVVSASDNVAVAGLALFRGDTELKMVSLGPFTFQVNDMLPAAEGQVVTYTARAVDKSGNEGAAHVEVTVSSTAPPEQEPLLVTVDRPVSPTFQPTAVITGTIGPGVPQPPTVGSFLASLSPTEARQGQTIDVQITGANTGFVPDETLVTFGPGIVVDTVTVTSPTAAIARITIDRDAGIGPRIVVATAAGTEAALVNAFEVRVGVTALSGRVVGATGAGLAGALVCVAGTTLCTTTGADGRFTLAGAPLNATRVVVTAAGFEKSSVAVELSGGNTAGLGDLQLVASNVLPPPPLPNAPPISGALARALGQGASELLSGPQNFTRVVQMIKNGIIAVGGPEIGVFDESGAQMNPQVTGAGYVSYRHHAVESMAWRQVSANVTTLGEALVTLFLSFDYKNNPALVPSLGRVLSALQAEVNRAWAEPARPGAPLMFVLFNQGRVASVDPPVLSFDTALNELQLQLLNSSFLTFRHREFIEVPLAGSTTARLQRSPIPGLIPAWRGDGALLEGVAVDNAAWKPGYPSYGSSGAQAEVRREVTQPWINVFADYAGGEFRSTLTGTMGKLCGQVQNQMAPGLKPDAPPGLDNPGAAAKFDGRDMLLQVVPKCPEVVKLASSMLYTQFGNVLEREKTFFNFFKKEGVTADIQSRASKALQGSRPNHYEIFPDGSSRQISTGLSAESKKLLGQLQDSKIENEALTEFRRQRFSGLQSKNYQDSPLYQDWQAAKNEAKKANLAKNVVKVAQGLTDGFFGMAEGVAFNAILGLEVDLLLQALRPRPPLILHAGQSENKETGELERSVEVLFERSDNDKLLNNEPNVVWTYELYRQTGTDVYRVALAKAKNGRREMLMIDEAPPEGTHLYRVVARRRVGGPIEYAPTDFDTVVAPLLGAVVPGLSGLSSPQGTFTPFSGPGNAGTVKFTAGISFAALQTALDPIAKTLKGLAYQVSDPSDPLGVSVTHRVAAKPVAKMAVDPFGRRTYLSVPLVARIFQVSPSFVPYVDPNFLRTEASGTHAGLAIDQFGHLYTDNVASNAKFGGRVFRFKYPSGEREFVGSVNYYSQLLQFAHATSVSDMAVAPSPEGESLFILEDMEQRIMKMTLPENLPPAAVARNVSQAYSKSALYSFDGSSSLTGVGNGTLYFNQRDNIVRVPPQYSGAASLVPTLLFRPGTEMFSNTTGLSSDVFGNLYVSDSNLGSITMLPWIKVQPLFTGDSMSPLDRKLFTIARGLSNPSGVKVRPGGKGLAFFDAERSYASVAFGFSAIVRDKDGNPLSNATVLVPDRDAAAVSDVDGVVVLPDLLIDPFDTTITYMIRHGGKTDSGTLLLTPGVHSVVELKFDPTGDVGPAVPLKMVRSNPPPAPGEVINPAGRLTVVSATATLPGVREDAPEVANEVEATCPTASIFEPATQMVADSTSVTVRGRVSPRGIGHVDLQVNGELTRLPVSADGIFSMLLPLPGAKTTIVVASDRGTMANLGCVVGAGAVGDPVPISQPLEVLSPGHGVVDDILNGLGYRKSVRGQVVDRATGVPIMGLRVAIPGTPDEGATDRLGVFQINTTFADYTGAIDHANQAVDRTIAELDLLASTLRAANEAAALDQIEVVLNLVHRLTYDQSPVAAANARPLLAVLAQCDAIMLRVAQAIEQGKPVAAADVDALQQAANRLEPWRNVSAIEITSFEAPDLSILIKVTP